jgi:hypothetical protein
VRTHVGERHRLDRIVGAPSRHRPSVPEKTAASAAPVTRAGGGGDLFEESPHEIEVDHDGHVVINGDPK